MNPDHVIAGWVAQLSLDSRGAARRGPDAPSLRLPAGGAAARPVLEPTAAPAGAALMGAASAGERVRRPRPTGRRRGAVSAALLPRRDALSGCLGAA